MSSSGRFRRDVSPDNQAPLAKEKQRSRTGCQTCRSRKVKCDERLGGCRNCERLNIQCPNSPAYLTTPEAGSQDRDVDAGLIRTQAGLRRSRTYRSCKGCRASKSRQVPAWVEAASSGLESRHTDSTPGSRSLTPTSSGTDSVRMHSSNPPEFEGESPDGPPPRASRGFVGSVSWLNSPDLPDKERVVLLIDEYFANTHSLRSFGFIHKLSFMQQLDQRLQLRRGSDILLYTLCAVGAKFYALRCGEPAQVSGGFCLKAGSQWADRALYLLFTNLNSISIECAMATVLLHEHELRVGNYASAFTLTGLAVRMAQSLQINLEASPDVLCLERKGLSASSREARRRLMWSIYTMDAWVGSGVDELTLIHDDDMKIQLPCNERNFVFQTPCIVETLEPGIHLHFTTAEARAKGPVDSIDLQAQFVRLISIRKQVLRYVKHLDKAKMPWLPESEFAALESALVQWRESLPLSLRFSQTAMYIRKDSSQLPGLLFLHITYHQTLTDLNRIGMQDLFRIRKPIDFPPEHSGFLTRVQDQCFDHATAIAAVFEEAARHGPDSLADTWLTVVAHDSVRVIVHFVIHGLGSPVNRDSGPRARSSLHSLLRALQKMGPIHSLAKPLLAAAVAMFRKLGLGIPPELDIPPIVHSPVPPTSEAEKALFPGNPAQFTPEYILNPLAIYRMARKEINAREKHTPEDSPAYTASRGGLAASAPLAEPTLVSSSAQRSSVSDEGDISLLDPNSFSDPGLHFPTSIDGLQTYLPLMLGNFSMPGQPEFDEIPGGAYSGLSVDSVYPLPPERAGSVDVPMAMTQSEPFPASEQTTWSG